MKYVRQLIIILLISFVGEILNYLLPLPVPASIYGLLLLFAGLVSGVIPLEKVKDTGHFLVEIMPLMFIPAAVGLLESWGVLQPVWMPIITITVVSTVVVIAAAGLTTQGVIRWNKAQDAETAVNGGASGKKHFETEKETALLQVADMPEKKQATIHEREAAI